MNPIKFGTDGWLSHWSLVISQSLFGLWLVKIGMGPRNRVFYRIYGA